MPGGLPGGAGDAEGPNAGEGAASVDDDEGTVSDGRGEGTAAGAKDPAGAASGSGKKDARKLVTVEDVRASYEDKNATVFSLDTTDLPHYREGVILKKGGHRFGVFSVDGRTSLMALKRQIAYFEKHEVDFVVALTPDKRLVERVADGLDIVVDAGRSPVRHGRDGRRHVLRRRAREGLGWRHPHLSQQRGVGEGRRRAVGTRASPEHEEGAAD